MQYRQNRLLGFQGYAGTMILLLGAAQAVLAQAPGQHQRIKPVPREPGYLQTTRIPDPVQPNVLLPSRAREYCDEMPSPTVAGREKPAPEKRRLPDGYAVSNRSVRVHRDQDWYVFQLAPVADLPDAPPLRILPNSKLGLLESVLADPSRQPDLYVTGRITEFNGANYLLIEGLVDGPPGRSRAVRRPGGEKPVDGAAANPSTTPATTTAPDREPTAEEVVKQLMQNRPRRALVIPPQMPFANPTTEPSELALTTNQAQQDSGRWVENTTLSDRPGRLVPGEQWWTLAFEDLSTERQQSPVRILPNQMLETAISLSGGGSKPVVLIVTGDIMVHKGVDYLLLRKVLVRRDLGNFR